MVMPQLSHQNEQFYPHGLKSLSKGMTLFRTDFRLFHYMHTNPEMRGGKSASSLVLYRSSHASEDDLHQTRHGELSRHALLQSTIQVARWRRHCSAWGRWTSFHPLGHPSLWRPRQ